MSSASSPRFLTFLTRNDNFTDNFGQPSSFTMQILATPHASTGHKHRSIFFGTLTSRSVDEGIWNPYAKLEAEAAGIGGGMVHLKSSYTQKYLCRASEDPNNPSIEAAADEHEEDISKWSCTLFRISNNALEIQYNNRMWTLHAEYVRSMHDGIWLRVDDGIPRPNPMAVISARFGQSDLDMLPTLPTLVCFKADNNRYLQVVRATTTTGQAVHRAMFTSNDRRDRVAQFRVVPARLRSVVLVPMTLPDAYLVRGIGGVYQASSNRNDWRTAALEPVTLDFSGLAAVAFRNVSHLFRHFMVRRDTDNGFIVSPGDVGIVAQAEFLIEDTVRSRQLSNIQFLYDDMKILEPTPVAVLTKNVVNGSKVSTQEAHLAFRYSEYQSNHWETTHSWQVGVQYGITSTVSARLPVLKFIRAETTVSLEVEAGYQGEHVAGETKVEESEMSTSLTLQVPPRTQSFVHMTVSRAKIQLPFTYTQRDVIHDGTLVASKKVDGLYEGEATHVDYQVEESSL
uniref:Amaranthin-like lectin n=1 Tax=Linum usitatissimum TaxID=4006 RepID=A0A097PIA7_LINUS|nr:amaranthin-like lectin [Linum usitatissimum]